ncbi:metal-sensitive transcriptional regulator [Neobacillus drentensis]|uniref:metal-sensitive transcriptional regulator n=1 Tax=Neobacillus drentensis TaxID=220684 RepID=UPI001F3A08C2|nr:metal-sensitive transcriptional regulator [Neobacillus drentensis]ULT58765.1 metal-sensitive transcriptional regulator [Neobacillus drentensis]
MNNYDPDNLNQFNEHGVSCDSLTSERKSHHSDKTKQNLVSRLNRIEGQIRGIKGLIEKDTYCDDVITQLAATQAALNSVAKVLLEGHMKSCVVERIQEGDYEVVDELLTTIQRLIKK